MKQILHAVDQLFVFMQAWSNEDEETRQSCSQHMKTMNLINQTNFARCFFMLKKKI